MNAFFLILETRHGCLLSFLKVKVKVAQLCWALCEPTYCNLPGSSVHGILQTRILEWIFPSQRSNPCLPHCRQILYHLCHQGSPRILEWVEYPFFFFFIFYFLYCSGFCHTLKWNSHGFTCVPHPDPPSHLPVHPLPLGFPSAPGPSACLMHPTWAADLFQPW